MRASRRMAIYNSGVKEFVLFDGSKNPVVNNTGNTENDSNWTQYDGVGMQTPAYTTTGGNGYITFTVANNGSTSDYMVCKVPIDVTSFTTCTVSYQSLKNNNSCGVFLSTGTHSSSGTIKDSHNNSRSNDVQNYTFNISNITGTIYFGVYVSEWTDSELEKMKLTKAIFE